MIKPDYIIRTNRRSLSLTVSRTGELIVRAPKKLALDQIINFINEKEKWIENKQKEIRSVYKVNASLINYEKFLFLGKNVSKLEVNKVKKAELNNDTLYFPVCETVDQVVGHALRWYKQSSAEVLKTRLDYFANLMDVHYESCSLTNSKNRWGSCDSSGNLKFNIRLAMLPHKVIDYIIIHELTHLLEFNHSKNFYKIIESIMPDYKRQISQLNSYGFLLQLLR